MTASSPAPSSQSAINPVTALPIAANSTDQLRPRRGTPVNRYRVAVFTPVLYGLVTGSMRCGMETFTLLGLDGIIGWSLRAVVSWLFPSTFTAKPSEG
jgi:hypothetical protein